MVKHLLCIAVKLSIQVVAIIIWIFISNDNPLVAQTTFQRTYGLGYGTSVEQTSDGGYIITGVTSTGRLYILKTDSWGDTLWTRIYGFGGENGGSAKQTADGGYIIGCTTFIHTGGGEIYLVKTDSMGDTLWTRIYSGPSGKGGSPVVVTSDGGYIIAGHIRECLWCDIAGYLMKTNSLGEPLWDRVYSNLESGIFGIQQTSDGGYIMTGRTRGCWMGCFSSTLLKTNSVGGELWMRHPEDETYGTSVQQTSDGGYIFTCATGQHLHRTSSDGLLVWTRSYGCNVNSVRTTSDGGYVFNGSNYLYKVNSNGDSLWKEIYTGNINSIQQTADGGYIMTGSINEGGVDRVYLLKTNSIGTLDLLNSISGAVFNDLNRNGARDSLEPGIAGWKISISGTINDSMLTDSEGNYSFGELRGAEYRINAEEPFGWGTTFPDTGYYRINLADHDTLRDLNFGKFGYNSSISGTIFNDLNGDGIYDGGEPNLQGWVVQLLPYDYYATTDSTGHYIFPHVPQGTYAIKELIKHYWNQTYPAIPGTHEVILVTDSVVNEKNFGNQISSEVPDMSISLTGGFFRWGIVPFIICVGSGCENFPWFGPYLHDVIFYKNNGSKTVASTVIYTHPLYTTIKGCHPLYTIYDALTRTCTWDVGDVNPAELGYIDITLDIAKPPILNNGDLLQSDARIEPMESDMNPIDNLSHSRQILRLSFDPNDKIVTPEGIGSEHITALGSELTYTIRFQNTGNDTAFYVDIRDTLDINLDMSTVDLLGSSHPCSFAISGERELKWIFSDIQLPDSNINEAMSHGFVSFRVKPNDGAINAVVKNRASIIFDYNQPVKTNTVTNYFCTDWTVSFKNNWNMVSLPVDVLDNRKSTIFPTASSNAFYFNNGYKAEDSIFCGKGYWLKFSSAGIHAISGAGIEADTIDVIAGWNMIGSISFPVAVSNIKSIPPNLNTSNFFDYDNGYFIADTISPGKGYWVKLDADGKLIISANASFTQLTKSSIKIVPSSELPPPPPEGISSEDNLLPQIYALEQAYPSPFNPTTTIKYSLPADSRVSLKVYNVLGQVVATLSDEIQSAGFQTATWVATGNASGIYFYKLDAVSLVGPTKSFTQVKKAVLLR